MKTLHISIIIGIAISFVILASIFFISSNYVSVKTDWSSYANGATITVSGEVKPIQDDNPVIIQIFYPDGELYKSTKVSLIENSNLYSYQFKIEKPMRIGTYDFMVKATYAGQSAITSFQYLYSETPGLQLP